MPRSATSESETLSSPPPRFARRRFRRRIHKNVPHCLRGDAEEVRPVLPLDVLPVDKPDVRLVHQRRGLEHVSGPFARHVVRRQPMQVLVDGRRQAIEGRLIAIAPSDEQLRDVGLGRHAAGGPAHIIKSASLHGSFAVSTSACH